MVSRADVVAVGAHPDDVELGCGAFLARLAASGRAVGILDLTAGERATRGEPAERAREARAAANALGVSWRSCLELPDLGLAASDERQVRVLVDALRGAAPRLLLLPHPADPHPDHAQTAALTQRAAFLCGLAGVLTEHPPCERPRQLLAYPGPRQLLAPDLVVDVTSYYERKRTALAAHASQFESQAGAATHLATGHFLTAIEGRDRAAGNTIGCELAEGFIVIGRLAADEVAWLAGRQ